MDILSAAKERLAAFGYKVTDNDNSALEYNIRRAEAYLIAQTNQKQVPDGLEYVWVDMAVGMFLADKKATGALGDTYTFDAPVKSVSEGDTSVTFAISDAGSAEDQFNAAISKMINPSAEVIAAYRKLVW